jgi:pectate lyase
LPAGDHAGGGPSFVTVSWNVFKEHNKTSLVGHSDTHAADRGRLKMTYHHNWFQSDSRLPRVRFGEVHVFNNFYDGVKTYGVASTMDAAVVVEANYFRNVRRPMLVG